MQTWTHVGTDQLNQKIIKMKLGDVLKKERENKSITVQSMAKSLGVSTSRYLQIENGDPSFEEAATLISNFANSTGQPVNSLYYPCGIPFQDMSDYEYRVS